MIAINVIVETALVVAAAVLFAAALRRGGPAGRMMLSAGHLSVLMVLALQINSVWLTDLDTWVWNWVDAHRGSRGLRELAGHTFNFIGKPFHVAIAGVVSGTLLAWRARSPLRAVVVIGAVGIGAIVEQILKAVVTRSPDNLAKLGEGSPFDMARVAEFAHSYPSGHVTGAATLLGTIAVCASVGRSRRVRTTWAAVVVLAVLFVAALALYVRAHLFGDVVGGMFLGATIVAAGSALISRSGAASVGRERLP
ncbi:phosphatase PAP2 family protein [Mycobacterium yunnanensis]|uniref:Phosphatase PAP2 family protein n=1 Tax=Mycobacterium yunnanensis TaxID=368477 RepID=A0A9X2Z810_9MYCO|nr:phosphatase PAP2 family protein [Mycobacterium yunnanensis]MCV7424319.1 phosphatase PAP2 family protein [Mycobacterium yunnanensis]